MSGVGAIGVSYGAGSLWVTVHESDEVVRVDPQTGAVLARVAVGQQPEGIFATDDGVWLTSEEDGTRPAHRSGVQQVVARVEVGLEPRHVAVGLGAVWVTNYGSATITRIDLQTNAVVATIDGRPRTGGHHLHRRRRLGRQCPVRLDLAHRPGHEQRGRRDPKRRLQRGADDRRRARSGPR